MKVVWFTAKAKQKTRQLIKASKQQSTKAINKYKFKNKQHRKSRPESNKVQRPASNKFKKPATSTKIQNKAQRQHRKSHEVSMNIYQKNQKR